MDAKRWGCVPAAVFFLSLAARGEAPSREATIAQNEALQAFDAGLYRDALDKFQLSYTLSPQPALLLAIARSAYKLGERDRAKACLFDFLRDDPKSLSASEAFDLLTRIEKESPATARAAKVRCVQPEKVRKPPAVAEAPPAPKPQETAPKAQEAPPKPAAPPPAPPAAQKPAAPSPWAATPAAPSDWTPRAGVTAAPVVRKHGPWSYVAMGTAVAAAGVATYFGTRNLSATSDWRNATTAAAAADARNRARSAATNANIAWAAAGALACTGAGLFFFTEF